MDYSLQKVYCSQDFLNTIIKNRKEDLYISLYKIINRISDLYINIEHEKLREYIESNQVLLSLQQRENFSVKSKYRWDDVIDINQNVDSIYLSENIPEDKCNEYRSFYGGLFLSNKDSDLRYFKRLLDNVREFEFVPSWEQEPSNPFGFEYPESWEKIFKQYKVIPINALAITDNFMFTDKFEDRKEKSLFDLLKQLVPKDTKAEFHLSIFTENSGMHLTQERAKLLIQEIKDLHLCDNIKITIIAHVKKSTTHDREILTNYHYIYSGSGFSVIDNNGIQEVAKGDAQCTLHNIKNTIGGTTKKHIWAQGRLWLKKIFDGEVGNSGTSASFIEGDHINRLFS